MRKHWKVVAGTILAILWLIILVALGGMLPFTIF